jgi:hypothetical protein
VRGPKSDERAALSPHNIARSLCAHLQTSSSFTLPCPPLCSESHRHCPLPASRLPAVTRACRLLFTSAAATRIPASPPARIESPHDTPTPTRTSPPRCSSAGLAWRLCGFLRSLLVEEGSAGNDIRRHRRAPLAFHTFIPSDAITERYRYRLTTACD